MIMKTDCETGGSFYITNGHVEVSVPAELCLN